MFKFSIVVLAGSTAASTTASIGLEMSYTDPKTTSKTLTTLDYEANTNFTPCKCDVTFQTCDAYCCCDNDCSFVSLKPRKHFLGVKIRMGGLVRLR